MSDPNDSGLGSLGDPFAPDTKVTSDASGANSLGAPAPIASSPAPRFKPAPLSPAEPPSAKADAFSSSDPYDRSASSSRSAQSKLPWVLALIGLVAGGGL